MDKFLIKYPMQSNESNSKTKGQRKALSPIQFVVDENNHPDVVSGLLKNVNEKPAKSKLGKKKGILENYLAAADEKSIQALQSTKTPSIGTQTEGLACSCNCHESTEESSEESNQSQRIKAKLPDDFWMNLAEERRVMLQEALADNKALHEEIRELQLDVEALTELAKTTEIFADRLKEAFGDDSGIVADVTIESDLSSVQENDD